MYTILLAACIISQSPEAATQRARAAIGQASPNAVALVPSAPAPSPSPSAPAVLPDRISMVEEMLAFLYVHHGPEQMEKSQQMFDRQTDSQIRIIYRVFLETKAQQQALLQSQRNAQQTLATGQANLNLERAKAYRDHLAREFQLKIVQSKQEQNLVHQHQHNLEAAMRFGFMNFPMSFPFPNYTPYPIYRRPGIYYPNRRYGW